MKNVNSEVVGIDCSGVSPVLSVKLNALVDIEISATRVADIFWKMNDEQQVEFINRLAEISSHKLPFQLQSITDNSNLNNDGRYLMRLFGDYADKQ